MSSDQDQAQGEETFERDRAFEAPASQLASAQMQASLRKANQVPPCQVGVSPQALAPRKMEMLTQVIRNALNMAIDIGRHRTIGSEDTALRYAIHGLAEGVIVEFFETLRMSNG